MGACIFCGSKPTTKEHTWAQWLRQYVPMPAEYHHQGFAEVHRERIVHHERKRVSGDLRRRGIRCVCAPCNSGWMSALQEENKVVLSALATGKPILLGIENQIALATWISVFATCSEYREPRRTTTSDFTRYIMWRRKVPPPTWSVWIANFQPEVTWTSLLKHYVLLLRNDIPDGAPIDPKKQRPNSHITTFTVGNLLAHVVGTNVDNLFATKEYRLDGGPKRLFRIWPMQAGSIYWGPPQTLTTAEAHEIGDRLFEVSAQRPIFAAD